MNKAYYIISWKPQYLALLVSVGVDETLSSESSPERIIVAISQGGFAEGVLDSCGQAKVKFLENEFSFRGLDLPRTEETFDQYFTLEEPTCFLDLDEPC